MSEPETAAVAYKWIAGTLAGGYVLIGAAFKWVFSFFSDREQKQLDPLIDGQKEMAQAVNRMADSVAQSNQIVDEANDLEKARQAVFNAQQDNRGRNESF